MATKQPKFSRNRKAPVTRREPGVGHVIPFFVVLAALTVVSFIVPLRPTVSHIEKRNLAEFPEFSVKALVSGDYFDDITTWFSDTFPGRETWIELASQTKSLYGSSDVMIAADDSNREDDISLQSPTDPLDDGDEPIPGATEGAIESATEAATEGPTEVPTEAATEAPINLDATEAPPTVPVEEWGGVDVGENQIQKAGTVIQIGDSLFQPEYFNEYFCNRYIDVVNNAASKYADQGIRVVSAPPPQAIGVLIEPEYLSKLKSDDQQKTIEYLNEKLNEDVYFVETVELLREHNSEYIYFRTDHHWTALGAYYVYEAICEQLDLEPASLEEDFELWDQGTFRGSLYYKAPKTKALKDDNVYAYNPIGNFNTRIYRQEGGSGFEWTVLTDMSKSKVTAKYSTFLSGDAPLVRIINNDLPDAGNVLIIKDSFGNAMAPFFTKNYHTVYVVDYRYYSKSLSNLVGSLGINDIIFLPNISDLQTRAVGDLLQKYKR